MPEIVALIKTNFNRMPGILYCLSRKETESCAAELRLNNIAAGCYHAGMSDKDRNKVQTDWIKNKVQVLT